jgi:hypothetical protein
MARYETEHLWLDGAGVLFVTLEEGGARRIGSFLHAPDWPERLGPEPEWYEAELADLTLQWDADRE